MYRERRNLYNCSNNGSDYAQKTRRLSFKQSLMLLGAIVVSVIALSLLSKTVTIRWEIFGDGIQYVKMSLDNFYGLSVPFCYRMFVPWLAHYLGEPPNAWLILNCAFMFLTGIGLYYFLREFKFNYLECLLGVWAFYMSHLGHIHWWRIYNVDTASFFTIVLAFLAMKKGRDDWFAFILFIGVLFKETILLVVPVYYFINATKVFDFRVLKRTALVCSFAIAAFLAIRSIHWPWQGIILYENSYSNLYLPTVTNIKANLMAHGGILETLRIIWFVWGPIWAFSVIGILRGNKFLNKSLLFILFNLAFIFVATDVERFTSFAFVVLIPLFLLAVHRYREELSLTYWANSIILLFLYIPLYGKTTWFTQKNAQFTISNGLSLYLNIASLIIIHIAFPLFFLIGEIFLFVKSKKGLNFLAVLIWSATFVFSFFSGYYRQNLYSLRKNYLGSREYSEKSQDQESMYSLSSNILLISKNSDSELAENLRWLQYYSEMNDTFLVRKAFSKITQEYNFFNLNTFKLVALSTLKKGDPYKAEEIADIGGMIDPYNFELYKFRFQLSYSRKNLKKIKAITEEFRKRHVKHPIAIYYHIRILKQLGKNEYAEALLDTLIYECKKNPEWASRISRLLMEENNIKQANKWEILALQFQKNLIKHSDRRQ